MNEAVLLYVEHAHDEESRKNVLNLLCLVDLENLGCSKRFDFYLEGEKVGIDRFESLPVKEIAEITEARKDFNYGFYVSEVEPKKGELIDLIV